MENQTEKERYLLLLDSRAFRLCERMNEFVNKNKKYSKVL